MVFIALPALQRSQRNQGYRNNLTVVVGLIQNWRSNNSGRPFPVNFADFHTGTDDFSTHHFYNYINGAGLEDGISIKIEGFTTETWSLDSGRIAAAGRIFILPNSVCEAPSKPFAVGKIIARRQSGKVSVWTLLEEGDGVVYCQDV
ncbi:MAG: hypothetical protein KIG14_02960 [Candidatus Sacchiramonaceae bacterium]|nr:hypothetical protein [Candidatus Saccharimonadaceae bacterium]